MKISNLGTIGIVRDQQEYDAPPEAFTYGQNVRFGEKGAISAPAYRSTLAEAPIMPKWLMQFPPQANPRWVHADNTSVYVLEGSLHSPITRLSGPYNGNDEERWNAALLNGIGVLNNTFDIPQLWTNFNSATRLFDLPNWPTTWRAKFIRPFKNFLIAGNMKDGVQEFPFRVNTSHPAEPGTYPIGWDPEDETLDTAEFDVAETPGHLVDGLSLGELFMLYKEDGTWALQYIGAPDFFRKWQILDSGLLARDCVAAFPGGHCVLTQDDLIVHQGSAGTTQSLVQGRLRDWLFASIDETNFRNCFMTVHRQAKEIWLCFPQPGSIYANMALIWNWKSGGIGFMDLPDTPFGASGATESVAESETWG